MLRQVPFRRAQYLNDTPAVCTSSAQKQANINVLTVRAAFAHPQPNL